MTRPVTLPLSLVQAKGKTYDVALERKPRLIDGEAPTFAVDWKSDGGLRSRFGWPRLHRELRVRTAIDSVIRRAEENKLFSYDMVRPDGVCWLSRISLAKDMDNSERKATTQQLYALLHLGLMGFGKAKTIARVTPMPGGSVRNATNTERIDTVFDPDGLVCITLQTPALLLNPNNLDEASGAAELLEAYRNTWNDLTEALHLERFFAAQRLAGGMYLAKTLGRWDKPDEDERYYPWILTEAGSVFVFKVKNQEQSRKKLEEWLQHGLPLAKNVRNFYGVNEDPSQAWKTCPYIPQNGYGEIAANLPVHEERPPPANESDRIETPPEDK